MLSPLRKTQLQPSITFVAFSVDFCLRSPESARGSSSDPVIFFSFPVGSVVSPFQHTHTPPARIVIACHEWPSTANLLRLTPGFCLTKKCLHKVRMISHHKLTCLLILEYCEVMLGHHDIHLATTKRLVSANWCQGANQFSFPAVEKNSFLEQGLQNKTSVASFRINCSMLKMFLQLISMSWGFSTLTQFLHPSLTLVA